MNSKPHAISIALALFGALALSSSVAFGAKNDKDVRELVEGVLATDYTSASYDEALQKLDFAKQACAEDACSPKVTAQVYVALGTVLAGGLKKSKEAEDAFVLALRADPTATLFADYITQEVQQAWGAARQRGSASGGSSTVPAQSTRPKRTFEGGRPPRGWRSAEAHFYFQEAVAAEKDRAWSDCAGNAQASLALENRTQTRFLAASCQERAGLWLEALADFEVVAQMGAKLGLRDTAKKATQRADDLRAKIPKIILRKPAKATDLVVKMNGVDVPEDQLGGEIWVNPGQREVTAVGKVDGTTQVFDQVVEAAEFETAIVEIKLRPKGLQGADQATIRCMSEARTREDIAKCVGGGGIGLPTGLNLTVGTELSGYHDSDHVDVVSPAFYARVENPTDGWGFGGSFVVDVVTAASTDIVATASPRWTELRYAPALSGHKKISDVDVGLRGNISVEPDYLATSVGASASADLVQKTVTPSLSYEFSYDISGRAGTSFDAFSRPLNRHGLDLGVTFVVDKASFFTVSSTLVFESGDSSKPYRYVPVFDPDVAALVQPGQSIDSVLLARAVDRPLEQLPTSRQRFALAARYARRFASSTARAEERLYTDNWGLKASTTDATYFIDVTKDLRVWPHMRFHMQSGVDFWKLAYVTTLTSKGGTIPVFRTGDRELGPLWSLTGGGGVRLALDDEGAYALIASADVVYSRFLDHLFVLQRFGYFGQTTLEVEFQ